MRLTPLAVPALAFLVGSCVFWDMGSWDIDDGQPSASSDGGADAGLPPLPSGTGTGATYYVSPDGGDDTNPGTSETAPWKTLGKVTSMTYGPGDSVLLQGGASFTGCPSFSGSNVKSNAKAPFTLGSYGTGKFTLTADCQGDMASAITISAVNGFVLRDGSLKGNGGGAANGVMITNPTTMGTDYVRVQDCDISGFYAASPSGYGAEIFVATAAGALDDVMLLNNTLHGANGNTSPDDNGITGYGNGQNVTRCLYQGNTVYDIGGKADGEAGVEGNGIVANGTDGCIVQYNVVHDIGANATTCGGPTGIWANSSNNVTMEHNEVYRVAPPTLAAGACGWAGFSLAGGVTNSVVQYNYAHDNFSGGIVTCGGCGSSTWGPNVIRYNILQNNVTGPEPSAGEISVAAQESGAFELDVYNNTVFNDNGAPLLSFSQGTFASGVIGNNVFIAGGPADSSGQTIVFADNGQPPSWATITHNDWFTETGGTPVWNTNGKSFTSFAAYQSGTGSEVDSISKNPSLTNPGSGGDCNSTLAPPTCPSGYAPSSGGSPVVGTGLDLTKAPYSLDVGPTDYFGHGIPSGSGSGYNLGADGAP